MYTSSIKSRVRHVQAGLLCTSSQSTAAAKEKGRKNPWVSSATDSSLSTIQNREHSVAPKPVMPSSVSWIGADEAGPSTELKDEKKFSTY